MFLKFQNVLGKTRFENRGLRINLFRYANREIIFKTVMNCSFLLKALPFVILIFFCFGCQTIETIESNKIPQSEIRQSYNIIASRERTRVIASFSQGNWGKSVDLDAPSKIEYNGSELAQSSLNFFSGTLYERKFEGAQTAHHFIYTNGDGKIFRNELNFEILELPSEEITINRLQETKIRLSRAVGKGENISISLKSLQTPPDFDGNSNAAPKSKKTLDNKEYDLNLNDELDESRSVIILKPKNLENFVNGKAVLSIEISREISLQQANEAGGAMRWSYNSTGNANVVN